MTTDNTRPYSRDSLSDLSRRVREFCEARDWDQFHSPKELAIGLVTESAELLAHLRFLSEDQVRERLSNADDRSAIEHEVADVLFFLLRFCDRNGRSLSRGSLARQQSQVRPAQRHEAGRLLNANPR